MIETRRALHAVAEQLLAGDLWRRTGRIGLRVTPGGFGQPETLLGDGRRRVRVECAPGHPVRLVILDGESERYHELSTLAEAARFAGIELGAPVGVYVPETDLAADTPLVLDTGAARRIAAWFALVEDALEEVRRRHAAHTPTITQLWPEHFDLACSMLAVNLGGSPGDADHDEPYLYVGPQDLEGAPSADRWNEPWGLSAPAAEVGSAADAVRFFESSLDIVTG